MKLSTRARYGARAMLDLAVHHAQRPVNIKEIAERQDISATYLEQLMLRLASHGLVRTVRGRGGGFVLSRPPSRIVMDEIVEALEGPADLVECVGNPGLCYRAPLCVTREIMDGSVARHHRSSRPDFPGGYGTALSGQAGGRGAYGLHLASPRYTESACTVGAHSQWRPTRTVLELYAGKRIPSPRCFSRYLWTVWRR